ncbi:hypothetical protein ABEG17_08495 [Pedococcus sp. KACC 23699]|uniref:Uncharacterized protein n=1 Tax=Pedococcus sp. KACC 23699 TaxID=3149228 RepID=A0AAU7JYN9_9MICO
MTVIERLYDNAWYVAHAAPARREELDADVTRTWMACEAAREDAGRARTVSGVTAARSALALSFGNVTQAEYHRARARAAEAARCTDIVDGHAFTISREMGTGGQMKVEIASCTLARHATISVGARGHAWTALFTDPQARVPRFSSTLGTDPWEAVHRACEWIITGRL